jgi:hypothetical protein
VSTEAYPWYRSVQGDDIGQGDILEACPVFIPPSDLAERPLTEATIAWEERDVIVMSQTCDMVKGREKIDEVLLCSIWNRADLPEGHYFTKSSNLEAARKGRLPAYHLLAACDLSDIQRDIWVVDFKSVRSLPLAFVRRLAGAAGNRLRLLPPYREHLSQGFARFFMRVGLPVDIPEFR